MQHNFRESHILDLREITGSYITDLLIILSFTHKIFGNL